MIWKPVAGLMIALGVLVVLTMFPTTMLGIQDAKFESWLARQGYVAYASPTGDLIVTGDLDVTGDISGAVGRTATYTVAASGAPAHVKAQADYVCDGTADNVEIQAAIDALPSTGGIVHLSTGYFNISSAIKIYPPSAATTLILEGEGMYSTILSQKANCNVLEHLAADAKHGLLTEVRDLCIQGDTGLYTGSGVVVTETLNAKDYRFIRVFVLHFTGYGIYSNMGWGWMITECVIEYCDTAAIMFSNTGDGPLISNNKILLNGVGIQLNTMGGTRIIANEIGSSTTWGIDTGNQVQDLCTNTVTGNWFRNNGTGGMRLYQTQHDWVITGNTFKDNGTYGIYMQVSTGGQHIRDNVIVGNRIDGSTNAIARSYDPWIHDNLIRDNLVDVAFPMPITYSPQSYEVTSISFLDVQAVSAIHVVNTANITGYTGGETITSSDPDWNIQIDVPRNVTVTPSDNAGNDLATTVIVTGLNARGQIATETFTFTAPVSVQTGNVSFATITQIEVDSISNPDTGDTLSVGIGSKFGIGNILGVPFKVTRTTGGAPAATATDYSVSGTDYTWDSTYRTLDMATGAGIVAGDCYTIWYYYLLNSVGAP